MSNFDLPKHFPWQENNDVTLHVDGDQFYPAMLNAIHKAKNFVLMEMYLFETGEIAQKFVEAFSNATKKGVIVKLLVDDFGGRKLIASDREQLSNSGVQLVFYNPFSIKRLKRYLYRTHRKYLIVDNEVLFIGGVGITDSFTGHHSWRETVAEVQGDVIPDWHLLFNYTFEEWLENTHKRIELTQAKKLSQAKIRTRLNYTLGGDKLEIQRALLNRMNKSRQTLWLASAYFIPSRKIRKSLRMAAVRGVDVRLLLPGPVIDHPSVRYASRRYYARLLRYGVRIFEYQHRFTHTKLVAIDDWYTIGSSNMDRWNFRWNLEANLDIDDAEATKIAREILAEDFKQSVEIDHDLWLNRSKIMRFKEWVWGNLDVWLTQFTNKSFKDSKRL